MSHRKGRLTLATCGRRWYSNGSAYAVGITGELTAANATLAGQGMTVARGRHSVIRRKSFNRLTIAEKQTLINATRDLKKEMGYWSVIVGEPSNYMSGTVTLENVSTYNLFIYLHDYVTRDDDVCTKQVNKNVSIDFVHSGPVFPVWHRHYILLLEKEFQRITGNVSFAGVYRQSFQ